MLPCQTRDGQYQITSVADQEGAKRPQGRKKQTHEGMEVKDQSILGRVSYSSQGIQKRDQEFKTVVMENVL